jgi:hypothetical protein
MRFAVICHKKLYNTEMLESYPTRRKQIELSEGEHGERKRALNSFGFPHAPIYK